MIANEGKVFTDVSMKMLNSTIFDVTHGWSNTSLMTVNKSRVESNMFITWFVWLVSSL